MPIYLKHIITFLFLTVSSLAFSQSQSKLDSLRKNSPLKSTYIKMSPLAIVELEPTLQIGIEYSLHTRIRLQHEIGYMTTFNPGYPLIKLNPKIFLNGVKIRTTIKFPFKLKSLETKLRYKYFGIDFMYKYLQVHEYDVDVLRLGGAYQQTMDFHSVKNVGAIHIIYGANNRVSRKKDRIIDWYFGVGLRYKHISTDAPPDLDYGDYMMWYDEFNGYILMSVMTGIKFGFGI